LLQISDLTLEFITEDVDVTAVTNLDLILNKGEILAVVGESGSGKSVTSLSILKLLPAPPAVYASGKILFSRDGADAVNLLTLSDHEITGVRGKDISMIFQEPMTSLNPVHTCGHQVMEAIKLHQGVTNREARQKAIELFEQVKLPSPADMINRYPHQLSGGQKQRVMIAMAISCHPAILIADEPTTALDVTVQKTILQLIKELQQQKGMGVIYITHDLGLVAEIADRVAVMFRGSIVETGTTEQIFNDPKHPYTKALLACRPAAYAKGDRLPVVSDFTQAEKISSPIKNSTSQVEIKQRNQTAEEKSEIVMQVKDLVVNFPSAKNFFGKTIRQISAVDHVSFDIYKNEILGLVGESGSGKTTLGRTLLRLIKPTSGQILFEGRDIAAIDKREMRHLRKDIQIIFQDPYGSLNPRLSIGNAILEPMKVHNILQNDKARKEQVVELLEKVNLKAEHFNRFPHEFSGGQRQRICIARALGLSPSFIICDESVSALDVSVQAQVLNLINDLKKEFGFTGIFISHDLSVVHYMSDRIMVMSKGKIVETGTASQVYHAPSNEYTKQLISSIPGAGK
jgi:peptide/nickel transport system ATP-binding protein